MNSGALLALLDTMLEVAEKAKETELAVKQIETELMLGEDIEMVIDQIKLDMAKEEGVAGSPGFSGSGWVEVVGGGAVLIHGSGGPGGSGGSGSPGTCGGGGDGGAGEPKPIHYVPDDSMFVGDNGAIYKKTELGWEMHSKLPTNDNLKLLKPRKRETKEYLF